MVKERITFSTRRFLVGKAGPFPRLVFREEVMLALDQFAHRHTAGEHGGFLIGRKQPLKSAEQYEISVERFVPVPQKSDASRLVITQEHYDSVAQALRRGERPEEIVGWVHTHPGFGTFLSNFDKEQHQRFFAEPWQIAFVIDTQGGERAVYRLVDGEWSRLSGYYVLRQLAAEEIGVAALDRPSPWLRAVLILLVLALLAGGGAYGYTLVRDLFLTPQGEPVAAVSSDPVVEPPPPASELVTIKEEPLPEPNLPQQITITPPSTVPRYTEYVVQRGDSLWSIAEKVWGDPSLFKVIVEENNIKNPSALAVGMVLKLPVDPRQ